MFGLMSAKRHAEELARIEALHTAHVQTLKAQISDLKKLVFSQTSATLVPPVQMEQDAILSQREETIQLSPSEIAELEANEAELNRVLSGNY